MIIEGQMFIFCNPIMLAADAADSSDYHIFIKYEHMDLK